jgi:hypothetical protein
VTADLPGPDSFEAASQFVTRDDVAQQVRCGADVYRFVDGVRAFVEAGFTDVALVQIGGEHQDSFLDWAPKELLPALREL